jgi:hypothetical protein
MIQLRSLLFVLFDKPIDPIAILPSDNYLYLTGDLLFGKITDKKIEGNKHYLEVKHKNHIETIEVKSDIYSKYNEKDMVKIRY